MRLHVNSGSAKTGGIALLSLPRAWMFPCPLSIPTVEAYFRVTLDGAAGMDMDIPTINEIPCTRENTQSPGLGVSTSAQPPTISENLGMPTPASTHYAYPNEPAVPGDIVTVTERGRVTVISPPSLAYIEVGTRAMDNVPSFETRVSSATRFSS